MNPIRHIAAVSVLVCAAGCAAGTAPGPAVENAPAARVSLAGAEEGFKAALRAYQANDGEAAYRIARQVAEQYPSTPWYQRSLLLMERALILLGRSAEAEAMMLRIRQEYPEMADYAVLFVAEHLDAGARYTEAAALYRQLIDRRPESSLARRSRFLQAEALLKALAYQQAADAYAEFLREDPDSDHASDAALGLARSLTGAMDLEAAAQAYQDLYIAYPGDPRDEEALAALELFRENGIAAPGPGADGLFTRGRNLFRARQYEKAAAALSASLEKDPQHPRRAEISLKYGISLFHTGRRTEATQVLERSLRENAREGRGPETLNWLGKSYSRMGDREKAVKTYLRIVTEYPDSEWADDALYLVGNVYRDANDRANTLKFYSRLAEEFPGSPFADSAIWWKAWAQYTAGDYEKAEQALQALIKRYPRSFLTNQAVYWQGRSCEKREDLPKASSYYRRVIKRAPYTYYGYLAAERLSRIELTPQTAGEPVSAASEPVDDAPGDAGLMEWDDDGPPVWTGEALQALSSEPSYRRALELMHHEMRSEAAAELWTLQERIQNRRKTVLGLSKTFFELGDYHRSFLLVARSYEKRLEGPAAETPRDLWLLAYPQGYWDSVLAHALTYGQDPYFIAAIIRQESHFQADALSPAGARGLMQVMPSTGEWVARMIRLNGFGGGMLFDADRNIQLGTWYVGQLMKRYRNDLFLVAAAYNAGPGAVASWLGKYGGATERDELVELIPYTETRWYVKRVLANFAEYRRIYSRNGKTVRLLAARTDTPWQDEEVDLP